MALHALIIDPERRFRLAAAAVLATEGFEVIDSASLSDGLGRRDAWEPKLVMLDHRVEILSAAGRPLRLGDEVVLAAIPRRELGDVPRLLAAGIDDFVTKPLRIPELIATVRNSLDLRRLRRVEETLDRQVARHVAEAIDWGPSHTSRGVRHLVEQVAASPQTTVLIEGELGTGKETLAFLIHRLTGGRVHQPFASINAAARPPPEIEGELFGRERATPSRALVDRASGGTLFIDEIHELGPTAQRRLLHLVEASAKLRPPPRTRRDADLRLVAGTSVDLADRAAQDLFRQDLLERLQVFRIQLPPLRESSDDVLALARAGVRRLGQRLHKRLGGLSSAAESRLLAYSFPRNVRELSNAIEQAAILEESEAISASTLQLGHPSHTRLPADWIGEILSASQAERGRVPTLAEVERDYVTRLWESSQGNRSRMSRLMGVSYPTVTKKLATYHLSARGQRGRPRS